MSPIVLVNGVRTAVAPGTTLAEVVANALTGAAAAPPAPAPAPDLDLDSAPDLAPDAAAGVAVALGDEVVPRALWAQRRVVDGDRVEIVTAVPGG